MGVNEFKCIMGRDLKKSDFFRTEKPESQKPS